MNIVIIQEFFFFLLIKALLRDLTKIRMFDLAFLLITAGSTYGLSTSNVYCISLLVLIAFIFFSWWQIRNIECAMSVTLAIFIWSAVVDHISTLVVQITKLPNGYFTVFVVLQTISLILLSVISVRTDLEVIFENNNLNIIAAVLLLIIYLYIIFNEGWKNNFRMIFGNLIILLAMVALILVLCSAYLKSVKVQYEIQQKDIQIRNDERYMNEIEAHYNELRRFRHEYQNVMISIREYLKTDDLKGLQKYYKQNIEPVADKVFKEQYILEDLSRIKVKFIKSILFNKLNYALTLGIKVHFDLKDLFNEISVNELDLAMVLGIILDNAIEASTDHNNGEIVSAIFIEKNSTTFLVQNTVFEQLPPLWKLKELNYSTKGENRGIGLNNLSIIVNRNENMILETRVRDSIFLQRVTVKRT